MNISLRLQKLEQRKNEVDSRRNLQQTIDWIAAWFEEAEKNPPPPLSAEEMEELERELCGHNRGVW